MNTDQLELRHLRCLVALAEEGTFTDAAIRLRTSQPAVSRAIARLEAATGTRLVERTTRSVALTEAGTVFYRAVVDVLDGLDAAFDQARGRVRPLRVGYAWAAFGRHTTDILRGWRDDHPDISIEVHRIDERFGGLTQGRVDLAVIRGDIADDRFHVELLTTEGRLAALPSGHRFAGRASLSLTDLIDPIALTPAIGTTTLELWPVESRPRRSVDTDNIDEWLTVIAAGDAIGVTAQSTAFQHAHHGIVFVPLTDVAPIPVYLAWPRRRPHPAVERFTAYARARMASVPPEK